LVLGPKVGDLDRIVESFDLENKNFETIICVEVCFLFVSFNLTNIKLYSQ